MTAYYFASRFARNRELRDYWNELLAAIPGAVVTSRWIDSHSGVVAEAITPDVLHLDPIGYWVYGQHDVDDIAAADTLVSFTSGFGGRGGRHIEHGYALALQKRIVIVGPRENIFHTAPGTEVFPTWRRFLSAERKAHQ